MDPYTYRGRQAMMERREELSRITQAEYEASPDEETDIEKEAHDEIQEILGCLYRSDMLRTAFEEHRQRKHGA